MVLGANDVRLGRGAVIDASFVPNKKLAIHRWVEWIAGFSSEFVREMLERYGNSPGGGLVLDPFAGVGTTLLEAYLSGYSVLGYEINPFAYLACRVKLAACTADPCQLGLVIRRAEVRLLPIEAQIDELYETGRLNLAPRVVSGPPHGFRTRIPFFSKAVELKVLHYLDFVGSLPDGFIRDVFRLALGSVMVRFSNYTYEPSLASRPGSGKPVVENAAVIPILLEKLRVMERDIRETQEAYGSIRGSWAVWQRSFFEEKADEGSVQLVVTSPPYLNNYHYVRNTRPQMYWLGLASSSQELKKLEIENYGKFWQTVRDGPPVALEFRCPKLKDLLDGLRVVNAEKGAYGGPGWANYAACYFNDTYRFMRQLRSFLARGGHAVIVIGNSILQGIDIPVDRFFAEIGELAGLEAVAIEPLRDKRVGSSIIGTGARKQTRGSTNGLYESAVILKAG